MLLFWLLYPPLILILWMKQVPNKTFLDTFSCSWRTRSPDFFNIPNFQIIPSIHHKHLTCSCLRLQNDTVLNVLDIKLLPSIHTRTRFTIYTTTTTINEVSLPSILFHVQSMFWKSPPCASKLLKQWILKVSFLCRNWIEAMTFFFYLELNLKCATYDFFFSARRLNLYPSCFYSD